MHDDVDDDYSHIPYGGPHVLCDRGPSGRFLAVAVFKERGSITVIAVASGRTSKAAVAACRSKIDEAMKDFMKERIEEELGIEIEEVLSVERVRTEH
jgi:hypothetical protein